MKLLVDSTLLPLGKAGVYSGIQSFLHDKRLMPTFDTFNKTNPDIYIADINMLTDAVIKNIEERPALKVIFIEKDGASEDNKSKVNEKFGNYYKFKQVDPFADLIQYSKSTYKKELKSDIVCIDQDLPEDFLLVRFPKNLKFRIFSPNIINSPYYCGFLNDDLKKDIYKSSKISFAGGDAYCNSIVAGCYPIAPKEVADIFNAIEKDETTKEEELEKMREEIYSKYNNFSILSEILNNLEYEKEAKVVLDKKEELK